MKIIKCDLCGSERDVLSLSLPVYRMHDGCDGLSQYEHPQVSLETIDICKDCLSKCTNIRNDKVMGFGNIYLQENPELVKK